MSSTLTLKEEHSRATPPAGSCHSHTLTQASRVTNLILYFPAIIQYQPSSWFFMHAGSKLGFPQLFCRENCNKNISTRKLSVQTLMQMKACLQSQQLEFQNFRIFISHNSLTQKYICMSKYSYYGNKQNRN